MKKHILSLAILLAAGGYAFGQTVYLSEIKVINREVTKTADRQANVSMELNLDELDMKRQHSLRLTPVILSADGSQEAELPPVVINGKVRDRVQQRVETLDHVRLNPDAIAVVRRKNGSEQTVEYTASVPFKRWMIGGNIQLRGQVIGCALCNEGGETATTGDIFPPMNPTYYKPFIAPKEEVVKRRSETRAAHIQFRQDSHRIDPNYLNNRSELDSVHHSIEVVKDNDDLTITGIYVTGYASPEGTYRSNARLAEGRTEALKGYIMNRYGLAGGLFAVDSEPENWEGLRAYVAGSNLADKEGILEIIDSKDEPDAKERRLRSAYPQAYRTLLADCYPGLRRSDYRIDYVIRGFNVDEAKQVIRTRPQNLSLQEMFAVAQTYRPGSPEFIEVFQIAVQYYPTDPVANLNAANALLEQGLAQQAMPYLMKAGDSPQAANARGVALRMLERYDEAVRWLHQASEAGLEEAQANLSGI